MNVLRFWFRSFLFWWKMVVILALLSLKKIGLLTLSKPIDESVVIVIQSSTREIIDSHN